jgi:hypothetical protein
MFELETIFFVIEFLAVDGLAARALHTKKTKINKTEKVSALVRFIIQSHCRKYF